LKHFIIILNNRHLQNKLNFLPLPLDIPAFGLTPGRFRGNGSIMKHNYFPPQFVILGYLLIILGIYFLARHDWVGFVMVPAGFIFSFTFKGRVFDLKNRKYREYLAFMGLKSGRWKNIPPVEYVSVYPERVVQDQHVASISSRHVESGFRIDLIISRSERIECGMDPDGDKALEKGREFATALNCKLLDFRSGKAVWIGPFAADD